MAFWKQIIQKQEDVAHQQMSPPLAVQNVSVGYVAGGQNLVAREGVAGAVLALREVSFTLGRGERMGLVGPNGAGKSTLFKLIVGILAPTEGRVTVFGRAPERHTCIAYVPQRSEVDWSFPATVADVVMMGRVGQIGLFRWPQARDRAIVKQSLARVNAQHLAHKQIGELSGGQQQRVFIARALAQEAQLLLLDEPLAGLDTPSQEGIFEIMDGLREDGVTVLMATHDLAVAAERFDRIMLLNRRVVAFDTPAKCLTAENLVRAYGGV